MRSIFQRGEGISLDLSGQEGTFELSWYDPLNGGELIQGLKTQITGGSRVNLGKSPEP